MSRKRKNQISNEPPSKLVNIEVMFKQSSNEALIQKVSSFCMYIEHEDCWISAVVLNKDYAVTTLHCIPECYKQLGVSVILRDSCQQQHKAHIHGLNKMSGYIVFKKDDGVFNDVPDMVYPMLLGKYITVEEDVVQQTPIRKIAKSSIRISERLEKLLKETNQGKKSLRSQVTVKQSHLSMEIAVNKRKPHVDLRERFSTLSSTTKSERSSIVGSPRKSDRSSIMESPTKKSDLSPNRTIISSVSSNPRKKASMELDDDILKKYRSCMSLIRQNSKRSNTHEVFYGRSNSRSNLFAEEVGSPESASPHMNSTSQKNRSGRSVKQNDDRVYIAHTLLNVHNQRPLSPFKLVVRGDQKFPFKVRKLLRHTTFSKLKRLTRKTQLNLGQQVASV